MCELAGYFQPVPSPQGVAGDSRSKERCQVFHEYGCPRLQLAAISPSGRIKQNLLLFLLPSNLLSMFYQEIGKKWALSVYSFLIQRKTRASISTLSIQLKLSCLSILAVGQNTILRVSLTNMPNPCFTNMTLLESGNSRRSV